MLSNIFHDIPTLISEFYLQNVLPQTQKIFTGAGKMTVTKKEHRQSPIDISTSQVCHDPEQCKVESLNIDYKMGDCVDVTCSEGGWKVNVARECKSTLTGSHLDSSYVLAQFHAHWSTDGTCGSEHTIDGKPMAAEIHFVFWNTKYSNICEALEKEDGLAVIGVLMKEGAHNEHYQPLLDSIKKANDSGKTTELPHDLTIDQLLPPQNERHFVTYLGSLTTPPFNECVTWTLMTTPVEVSKEQLNICRKIVPSNYRACQDLCERQIKSSRCLKA